MARNQDSDQTSAPAPQAADAQVPASGSPSLPAPIGQRPVTPDVQISTILAAVEQQLTRYFGATAAHVDAVQQAAEAGRAELITHFQQQIDTLREELDRSRETARASHEQSAAVMDHVDEAHAALTRRMDDTSRSFGEHVELRTDAVAQHMDEAIGAMRITIADHVAGFGRRADESDTRTDDRLLAMEERLNEQTVARLAAVESTMGRISGGIDEAIVALSNRIIELESDQLAALGRLDQLAQAVSKVDEEAVTQLREQTSAAVGESMLVRIELERVATSTGDQFDRLNARVGELAAEIADTEMDVSTAIQLERLEEIERALAELDPAQFIRKTELPKPPGAAMAAPGMAPPPPNGASLANSSESSLSSW